MSKMSVGAVLAGLLQLGVGVRHRRQAAHSIAGVPMYNYGFIHQQATEASIATAAFYDWNIKFNAATDAQLVQFCGGEAGQSECRIRGHPDQGGVAMVIVRCTQERLTQLLEAHGDEIEFVEPDAPMDIVPDFSELSTEAVPWSHNTINLARASYTGRGVHIYVMDTGVRTSHSDFGGRAIPTLDTLANNGIPRECNGDQSCSEDTNGHGTHCAGTAGGATYGVATQATLYAMRTCCGAGGNTHAGMDWVAVKANKPAIMTVSLGSATIRYASRAVVDAVVESGVTVFVAAGNNNIDACQFTYSYIPSAISVGATDSNDRRASFSNYGTCNDIYAPGVTILSAWKDSDTASRAISGTSMACPLAAGAGALLMEENPDLTPAALRARMLKKAAENRLTGLKSGDPNLLLQVA